MADHVDVEPLTEHETESVEAVHPRVDPGVVEDRAGDAFLDDLDRLEPRHQELVGDHLAVERLGIRVVGSGRWRQPTQGRVGLAHHQFAQLR